MSTPSPVTPEVAHAPVIPGVEHLHSGKVRDLYRMPDGHLLMVASDRISAFDHVLASAIPDKGRVLTSTSLWWFDRLEDLVPNHVFSRDVPRELEGRAVVVEQLEMYPVECIARGYLTGSALAEYDATGAVSGVSLPEGLEDGSRLPEPIFTPTTKGALGEHDESLTFEGVVELVGAEVAAKLRDLTLAVYARAAATAGERGLLLADTKLEFGARPDGTVVLADEVLTPDSSRFWDAEEWKPGEPPAPYDKQLVRNWLLSEDSGWDRDAGEPPPALSGVVVEIARARYIEAYERLTGLKFS